MGADQAPIFITEKPLKALLKLTTNNFLFVVSFL